MNPIQQQPGEALHRAAIRIAFVREAFRPRLPYYVALIEDTRPVSPARVKLPGNPRTPVRRRSGHRPV